MPEAKKEKQLSPAEKQSRGTTQKSRGTRQQKDGAAVQGAVKQRGRPRKKQPEQTESQPATRANSAGRQKRTSKKPTAQVRIIPLGGLDEIGKNITAYECGNDIILIDCGMAFPDEDMPGVDLVIPDFTFVVKNKDRIKGLFLTHGHEDHIGAIPYLLKEMRVPIYGTRLTLGLVKGKLEEHRLSGIQLHECSPGSVIKAGCFSVEFIHVNHSIPDAVGFAIRCSGGLFVHTGDFKIDTTPIDGEVIDLARFAQLGKEGVTALLADSTNAERAGFTPSESLVGHTFSTLFRRGANQRIIVASFSSNIHRIQQIIDEAVRCNRKVAVSGRSMINVVNVATELGYLKVPEGVLIDISLIRRYRPEQLVIITTGSQGEPMSALYRMAFSDHRQVDIVPGDMIIISATPIPGNEKLVTRVVNQLMKLGAEVVYERMYDVHVSGHACAEELKMMLSLTRPKFFIPLHGEYKHLAKHAALAEGMGIDKKNILISRIGDVIEIAGDKMSTVGQVQAGQMLVDGLGVGDVGNIVLRDRKHLSEDGLIVVVMTIDKVSGDILAGPDIVTRGFVYVREAEGLIEDIRAQVIRVLDNCQSRDWAFIKGKVRDDLSRYIYDRNKRSPMILPIIMEV